MRKASFVSNTGSLPTSLKPGELSKVIGSCDLSHRRPDDAALAYQAECGIHPLKGCEETTSGCPTAVSLQPAVPDAMVKAHKDGIAQLMREHVKREADDILLKSLLDRERSSGKVLHDWREELTRLQRCAPYQEN